MANSRMAREVSMKQRQRRRKLNLARRPGVGRVWLGAGDYFCISHSERDWPNELGSRTWGAFIGEPIQGEIGVLDGGIRFIVSEVDHVSDQG